MIPVARSASLRVLLVGESSLPRRCSEFLLSQGHSIAGVATPDSALAAWAASKGIPTTSQSKGLDDWARQFSFDVLFSIVNGLILPDGLIDQAKLVGLNFHDGPLPRYSGFNSTSWALFNREATYGVTWHEMKSKLDAGSIFEQEIFDLSPGETAFTLNAKCFDAGYRSFERLIVNLAAGTVKPRIQDLSQRTYCKRYDRPYAAGLIQFDKSAEEIDALARGLDFGTYANPMGYAKLWDGKKLLSVRKVRVLAGTSAGSAKPGLVLNNAEGSLQVATATLPVELTGITHLDGSPCSEMPAVGFELPYFDKDNGDSLTEWINSVSRHEPYWVQRLANLHPTEPALFDETNPSVAQTVGGNRAQRLAALAGVLARLSEQDAVSLGMAVQAPNAAAQLAAATILPLSVEIRPFDNFDDLTARCEKALAEAADHKGFAADLPGRFPQLRGKRIHYGLLLSLGDSTADLHPTQDQIAVRLRDDSVEWTHASPNLIGAFQAFLAAGLKDPSTPVRSLPLISEDQLSALTELNATESPYDSNANLANQFASTVAQYPDRVALRYEEESLTYRDLDRLSNRWARMLQTYGAAPGKRVGIAMDRSARMVAALLAVLKTGAAYVPLDPNFPKDRLLFMAEDAELTAILTDPIVSGQIPCPAGIPLITLDSNSGHSHSHEPVAAQFPSSAVAYVIYTSGSTGKPKGVMVTHRNVVSFFHGLDLKLEPKQPGTWLAVTSISFDISVLELFWTLTRGFTVVVQRDARSSFGSTTRAKSELDFSLYYFAADIGQEGDRYRLLLEGAQFADRNGFSAVWTPERHFHHFGGLYPNPSVTSAALAVTTRNVKIRAGSVVLPLHHPARVAEEWSVVDNLSGGRVEVSFASGWNARDFVFAPQNYSQAKTRMFEMIKDVQKLWRGEKVSFPDGKGEMAEFGIMPPPVQKELPYFITTAGNTETFKMAGESGGNLLTHLLGQTFEDLTTKINIYREARRAAGHPGPGRVVLMLHTFVGEDREEVRKSVRGPLIQYLKTSADLIKKAVEQFPAFQRRGNLAPSNVSIESLTQEEQDAIMGHAFDRYFETSGLFGTVSECVEIARKAKATGVDEVACLIDFGIAPDTVLAGLTHLDQVRRAFVKETNYSIAAQIERHAVTHMQCTPSYARMLTLDTAARKSLGQLEHMLVGGEALPGALASELLANCSGAIWNMYGPTETTIWSTTYRVDGDKTPPIGKPLANQRTYILDKNLLPVPVGVAGELYIGGDGVTPGYWKRGDLTAERFVTSPFADGLLYKTGDLAKLRADGNIEFLGRADFQVKIRGHRIELGEIESALLRMDGIQEAAVLALPGIQGDPELVGFVSSASGASVAEARLRSVLRDSLPDIMVPSEFVGLEELPKTPNGKIDRKALGALHEKLRSTPVAPVDRIAQAQAAAPKPSPAAAGIPAARGASQELETEIGAIWGQALGLADVNPTANFFDLGGHSLLAIQVHAAIKEKLQIDFSLVDLFELPTVRSLAGRLAGLKQQSNQEAAVPTAPGPVTDRAQMRREMMQRRLGKR